MMPPARTPLHVAAIVAASCKRFPSDDELDWVLWERTAFPVCGIGHAAVQVRQFYQSPEARRAA